MKDNKLYPKLRSSRLCRLLYDRGVLYFLLSFMIPAAIMLLAFRKQNIHPFGNSQILVVDLWHQYYPFFRVVREKLLTGGSFLYSWQNGMGTNFLSLISYYAASPLNWISVFFDEEHVRDALTYILIAKIGFAGAFFSCFLRYTYGRRDLSIVPFSSMFALCSYMLGYYWNVMWFDTIALFPLVMLGIVALCREGKWKLYTLSLALSLISNYYIAYFTCIFTIFMFAASIIIEGKHVRDYFSRLWLILRSSVLAIGLGGFMLLPAYYGLQLTYSVNNTFPQHTEWYEKWTDIFANLLSYSEPAMKEGLPNFACGMLAVILFGVFLFSGGIRIREKISMTLMLALIAVSCNMNKLNYIWHGFHVTNQIPYRFAFIFCFVLTAAAYRAYDVITARGLKLYQLFLLLLAPIAVFYLNYRKAGDDFTFDGAFRSSAVLCGAYIFIFIALKLFPFGKKRVRLALMNLFVSGIVVTELFSNACIGTRTVGTSDYVSYPASQEQVQAMLGYIRESDDSPFYRIEMTGTYTLNDSALYGYYGVSQFSSSANVSVTKYFRRLGLYSSEAGNRYYYRTSGPLVNGLLGIKYLISKYGSVGHAEYHLEHLGSDGSLNAYKNRYPLSLGFMMNSEILELEDRDGYNPFEYQNDLVRLAAGVDGDIFTPQPVKMASYDNVEVQKDGYGDYSFTVTDKDKSAGAEYEYAGVDGSFLYGYLTNGGMTSAVVKQNGDTIDNNVSVKDYPIVFPMGDVQGGGSASVELKTDDDVTGGSFRLMVYAMDVAGFERAYDRFAGEQLGITSFSDTEIRGNISVKQDGVLYLAMPYEKGWRVYCDGEAAETVPVMNAMLGAKIPAGEHEIVIRYTPDGFSLGLLASGSMLMLFILLSLIEKRRKKLAPEIPETAADSDIPEKEGENGTADGAEEPQGHDGVPGDELPRLPEAGECGDGAGGTGEQGVEGTE